MSGCLQACGLPDNAYISTTKSVIKNSTHKSTYMGNTAATNADIQAAQNTLNTLMNPTVLLPIAKISS